MMGTKELSRLRVITSAIDGACTVKQAVRKLRLSTWRVKALKRAVREQGDGAVIHRNAGRHPANAQRRLDNKPSPKQDDPALMGEITALFKKDRSPDQNAGRLEVLYPEQSEEQASTSTISTHLYQETAKARCGQILDRVSIDKRPNILEEKSPVGDWEGGTIERAGKNACIATIVDRNTKLLLAKIMPDKAAIGAFTPIPAQLRNTLTQDNGKEFATHKGLWQTLGIDSYFAHRYHLWERGLNEHTRGLIRQYLPPKIPFDTLTQK